MKILQLTIIFIIIYQIFNIICTITFCTIDYYLFNKSYNNHYKQNINKLEILALILSILLTLYTYLYVI
jgi:hypothetical protein